MIAGKKLVVVLPAYNAERTLERTLEEVDRTLVDDVVLVDDASQDRTAELARRLGIEHVIRHEHNRGYGGNQKTCYARALELGADIVIMLHPDYQYTPKLIPAMGGLVASGLFPAVLGSRILGGGALAGGMPLYKYIANRALTAFQNLCTGAKLSEYHTGYRAFSAELLRELDLAANSDDFIFDNQMLGQIIAAGHPIGEVTCPTRYFQDASSINFRRSVVYGLGVLGVSLAVLAARLGLPRARFLR
ncbi:glycosyltransferase family 2 protein [Wenzhouxiangella marina]|uniref:Glycosyl transferase family 2 n=1 Tax=Wenzhouxiangella marina TaxID=1579979 RepID=A0A0K0XXU0_9GAMM|nr:glycosyltransferase family 2 protein [Wenzhouxiangella marina]AKS42498.1 Glycosyl transferase family 2 [Wenzhouxiangella marina]MBB6085726.1 glycosyltransferase involved in cell wall biosynthesis [Wenzhouxiangella marina]